MTHELFQTHPALGAFSGMTTPFGLTNPALQAIGVNPMGLNPQLTGGLQNPLQTSVLQNPLVAATLQNPVLAAALQNPVLAATLQNPVLAATLQYGQQQHNPYSQLGLFGSPFGQIGGSPFGQTGSPFGQIGHGQFGSPYGQ